MPFVTPKTIWNDLKIALSLLTRLPVPQADFSDQTRPPARAAWAYPLVGLVVGALAVLVGWIAGLLGIPPLIGTALMVATLTVATGAMHEDGLADCADGFWGGWDKARRLEIMKDSAIGSYGSLALIAAFLLKYLAMSHAFYAASLSPWLLLIPAVLSRAAMVAVMELLPNARDGGLSAQTGRPGKPALWVALAIGFAAALCAPDMIRVLAATLVTTAVIALLAKAKIGGQTGDVLGATQVLVEIAVLTALVTPHA